MANKKAFIVGINYTGTGNDLRGCINDAKMMDSLLRTKYGFTDVKLCLEKDATTANIKAGLDALVANTTPGDILFFHFSGHGSQIYDGKSDSDFEPDGLDEILCPIDLDWRTKVITDDYLKGVFDRAPLGVNVTAVLDCCHSGSGLDQEEQYQPHGVATRTLSKQGGRYLPPPEFACVPDSFVLEAMDTITSRHTMPRSVNKTTMLIAGCQSHQTAADAFIEDNYYGACTFLLNQILKETNYNVSYKHLVEQLNQKMIAGGFTQRPELNGVTLLQQNKFLDPLTQFTLEEQVTPIAPPQNNTHTNTVYVDDDEDKMPLIIIGIVALVVLAALVLFR